MGQYLPPDGVDVDSAMIYAGSLCLLGGEFTAVVVVVLDLLSGCPAEDVGRLVIGVWRQSLPLHLTAAAVIHLEHRGGTSILEWSRKGEEEMTTL